VDGFQNHVWDDILGSVFLVLPGKSGSLFVVDDAGEGGRMVSLAQVEDPAAKPFNPFFSAWATAVRFSTILERMPNVQK
jgi:hypothetical protein